MTEIMPHGADPMPADPDTVELPHTIEAQASKANELFKQIDMLRVELESLPREALVIDVWHSLANHMIAEAMQGADENIRYAFLGIVQEKRRWLSQAEYRKALILATDWYSEHGGDNPMFFS